MQFKPYYVVLECDHEGDDWRVHNGFYSLEDAEDEQLALEDEGTRSMTIRATNDTQEAVDKAVKVANRDWR